MSTTFYTYVEDAEGREHDLFVKIIDVRGRYNGTNEVVISVSTSDGLSAERLLENLPDKERERVLQEVIRFVELEYFTTMRSLVEYFNEE